MKHVVDLESVVDGIVYGIWSPDRSRLYIGSTTEWSKRRKAHRVPELLGCHIEVVLELHLVKPSEVRSWEDRAIIAMRTRGIVVVNNTNSERCYENVNGGTTQEQRRARGRKARSLVKNPNITGLALGRRKHYEPLKPEHKAALIAGRKRQAAMARIS